MQTIGNADADRIRIKSICPHSPSFAGGGGGGRGAYLFIKLTITFYKCICFTNIVANIFENVIDTLFGLTE